MKKIRIGILLYMVLLALLFLMCSTDLIIREPEKEVYQVAVIIEDIRDDNYSNFRKGMDQAAVELNADVRFITLYEKLDKDQQLELISREQQDGTDALIVVPADEDEVVSALLQRQVTIPVVLLGCGLTKEEVTDIVVTDYENMGETLADRMLQEIPQDCAVVMFCEPEKQSVMSRRFLEGAKAILEAGGHDCRVVTRDDGQGFKAFLETLGYQGGGQIVIIAESPEILTETAGLLSDSPSFSQMVWGLYGRGSTLSILNYLDRGVITGICTADEFSMGYFSVYTAVKALEGIWGQEQVELDIAYIQKKDLRDPAYEAMLFPIE